MSSPDLFAPQPTYDRFTRSDRVQHAVMVVSFLVLTVTGLPQKYIYLNNRYLDDLIDLMGGIEGVRVVHRWAATVLMLATVYHLLAAAHRVLVRRVSLSMLPRYQDVVDALQASATTSASRRSGRAPTATPGRRKSSTGRSSGARSS
jgi:cytochrome b subunit of formate dehydrogenase